MKTLSFLILFSTMATLGIASEKPNILLILVDDLKPALGCYGDKAAKTPNMDALADRGIRFEAAYCNQAVCAPSRFTLMLGSHSTSTGLYGLGSRLREIMPEAVTMPQFFAKHGYSTESLGKIFHIGHGNPGDPDSFSVPHFKEKVIEYADPASKPGNGLTREEAMFQNQPAPPGGMNQLPRGAAFEAPEVSDEAYADGRVAKETVARLKAAKERGTPFFIAAGFARPHLPFSAPKRYWDLYDAADLPMPEHVELPQDSPAVAGKRGGEIRNYFPVPDKGDPEQISRDLARKLIHGYYASTSYVDAQIGKVLDGLASLGLSENTIVVLWGDHGFHLGDLGIWTKHTNYEQANRIPLVFAGPGITPGTVSGQLAESVDVFPTLADLAGLPLPSGPQPIDGISLKAVIDSPAARLRNHAFHAYPKKTLGRAIRTERYRLVEWKAPGADAETAEIELYDYQSDPGETKNHAREKPEVVKELRAILNTYPEAVSRSAKPKKEVVEKPIQKRADTSPRIAGKPIEITAELMLRKSEGVPHGVVLAQGGRQHGYALHFIQGRPVFDLRIDGKVTRLESKLKAPLYGPQRIDVSLGPGKLTMSVKGRDTFAVASPGLIPVQPQDPFSVGHDVLSAAGEYEAPNAFTHMIVGTRVEVSGKSLPVSKTTPRPQIEAALVDHDRSFLVTNGWIRDPYIVTGPDGVYYLTGTTPNPGDPREKSDPTNTGLGETSIVGWRARVWKSDDLIDWKPVGEEGSPYSLLDGIWPQAKPERFDGGPDGQWRLWAPELHWIDEMKRWALVHTSPSPMDAANLSLSAGSSVSGPWSNPLGAEINKRHDPSLFQDDNGTWYLIWGATKIVALTPDFSGFAGEVIEISPKKSGDLQGRMGHEGCLIQKIHGKYVLFGTGWSTGKMRRGSYNLYYATADQIEGPYSERKFAGRFLGHGTPFQDKEGRWWCTAFYNANVPPLPREGIQSRDLSVTAQTINERGTTIVPLDVRLLDDGELHIRAKDPAYAIPGPDEAQEFDE